MAKKTTVTIHDDLDGSEGARTVKFGLDGKNYEIDLSPAHETELRTLLEKYVKVATVASWFAPAPSAPRRAYGTGPKRTDTKDIREWLRANGRDIPARGRIPIADMEMYKRANPDGAPAVQRLNASGRTPAEQAAREAERERATPQLAVVPPFTAPPTAVQETPAEPVAAPEPPKAEEPKPEEPKPAAKKATPAKATPAKKAAKPKAA